MSHRTTRLIGALTGLVLAASVVLPVAAEVPEQPQVPGRNPWLNVSTAAAEYYDVPVREGLAHRTWTWGPQFWIGPEAYAGGHVDLPVDCPFPTAPLSCSEPLENQRWVAYTDKGRLEDSGGSIWSPDYPFPVTSGLLATELMTGRLQLGDADFEDRAPAAVPVAGDPDTADITPTYAVMGGLMPGAPLAADAQIVQTLDAAGDVGTDARLGTYGVTAVDVEAPTKHTVASVFWDFMHSEGIVLLGNGDLVTQRLFPNPFMVTGYPTTEAFWAKTRVAGVEREVLLQCFERRCLTFTPDNPDGWKVEMANIGQHYFLWRYGGLPESVWR